MLIDTAVFGKRSFLQMLLSEKMSQPERHAAGGFYLHDDLVLREKKFSVVSVGKLQVVSSEADVAVKCNPKSVALFVIEGFPVVGEKYMR